MRTVQQGTVAGSISTEEPCGDRCAPSEISPPAVVDLPAPPPLPKRWIPHRKAEVVAAVQDGLLTYDDAMKRYSLSVEEFLSWQRKIALHGLAGLQVGRTQRQRNVRVRSPSR